MDRHQVSGGPPGPQSPHPLVVASWRRCEDLYHLVPDVSRPVLRFQESEIRQRADRFADRLGDGIGHLAPLGRVVAAGGGTLLVSDADQVLLPLASAPAADAALVRRGIVPGSCWDERIAGTNGIQMALTSGDPFTVRGAEHFFVGLRQFSCCSVPILDAGNRIAGALTSAAVDRGDGAGQRLAAMVMQIAARRLQAAMFRRRHAGQVLVSLAPLDSSDLDGAVNALIALDGGGRILAATRRAARMAGSATPEAMTGQTLAALFGVGLEQLIDAPGWFARSEGAHPTALGLHVTLPLPPRSPRRARPRNGRGKDDGRAGDVGTDAGTGKGAATGAGPRAGLDAGAALPPAPPQPWPAAAMAEAEAALRHGLPVLVLGETGTGKTSFAQHLHRRTAPAQAQAFTVDCAQIEATEAGRQRARLFAERALQAAHDSGGAATLILDHLESLPPAPQAWLVEILSMLEERTETADGALARAPALRVVALCARPPEALIAAGTLRDDLLYRLQGARVTLAPLRDRTAALPDLLARLAQEAAGWPVPVADGAMSVLMAHSWPGNLREARHVMRLACGRARGGPILAGHLPSYLAAAPRAGAGAEPGAAATPGTGAGTSAEARIAQALHATGWNVSAAARRLGLSRATLHRKIRSAGLDRPGRRPA